MESRSIRIKTPSERGFEIGPWFGGNCISPRYLIVSPGTSQSRNFMEMHYKVGPELCELGQRLEAT